MVNGRRMTEFTTKTKVLSKVWHLNWIRRQDFNYDENKDICTGQTSLKVTRGN